jgi:hypothetical protein
MIAHIGLWALFFDNHDCEFFENMNLFKYRNFLF